MEIKLGSNDFVKILAIVAGMAFIMISVAYGITYIIAEGVSPIPPYLILFIFAVGFVLASVFFEKRGAMYPWSLVGGAIASAISAFIITASIGGIKYIWEKGLGGLSTDTAFYALSISIILSMVLLNLARHKL
ncbi:MAG: heat-shock protein [Candidatus Methanoperedens sp.]|nr:heat-shock protein [Candidatus Methanoperedens sp.]MCZ7395658.1 heat-shock protein [Candidatus Methanoperedens sp.]